MNILCLHTNIQNVISLDLSTVGSWKFDHWWSLSSITTY